MLKVALDGDHFFGGDDPLAKTLFGSGKLVADEFHFFGEQASYFGELGILIGLIFRVFQFRLGFLHDARYVWALAYLDFRQGDA